MCAEFDRHAKEYIEIIDRTSSFTGEKFEFFIDLRISLMAEKMEIGTELRNDLKILDFGCGIGVTEAGLKKRFPRAHIYGVDSSAESIRIAEQENPGNVIFKVIGTSGLPFENDTFDIIYSNGTFHHISTEQYSEIFKELFRVMKKSGAMFIFENNPYNPVMVREMKRSPLDKDARPITPARLRKACGESGFIIAGTWYYFFYPKMFRWLRWTERYLRWLPLGAQYFIKAGKR